MMRLFTRLLAIRPGEETKTLWLYALHLIFYVGLIWGESASETLFLSAWGAQDLSLMFVGNAVLSLAMALTYAFFADRFSNERILQVMLLGMIGWLISVRILLGVAGGPHGAVYPYFYLIYLSFRDLSTLQILNYINDLYDTRAAKRMIPIMLSAGVVGGTFAGFSNPLLSQSLGVVNVPVLWAVTLVIALGMISVIRRKLKSDFARIEGARRSSVGMGSPVGRLVEGYRFVRASDMMRWLALATLGMVVLMRLLNVQASQIFVTTFSSDPQALFNFYGLFAGVSNVCGILLQSFVVGRLVSRFGVGTLNLVFPSITLATMTAITVVPSLGTAITARLNHITFKQVFRNPLDAMLFNCVPLEIKGRAKAFVNGLVVPLGTFVAGLVLLATRWGNVPPFFLPLTGLALAGLYLTASFRVRSEYGRSLTDLLAQDEMSVFRSSRDELEQADPAMVVQLERRLETSDSEPLTIFLGEVLYELQAGAAIPRLLSIAAQRGPGVRAGIIELLVRDGIGPAAVREFCLHALDDPDGYVRTVAIRALDAEPGAASDERLVRRAASLLDDAVPEIQSAVVPLLLTCRDETLVARANQFLKCWLDPKATDIDRIRGLETLAQVGDSWLLPILEQDRLDPSPARRHLAAELLSRLIAQSGRGEVQAAALAPLKELVADPDESVRLVALAGLGQVREDAGDAIFIALRDPSFAVRQAACALMGQKVRQELQDALEAKDYFWSESATFLLAGADYGRARQRLSAFIRDLTQDAYTLRLQSDALDGGRPGADLLKTTLAEYAGGLIDQIFWLVSALGSEGRTQVIRRSLASENSLTRANAAEALESLVSPPLARTIVPLVDATLAPSVASELGLPPFDTQAVLAFWWPVLGDQNSAPHPNLDPLHADGWAAAAAMYASAESTSALLPMEQRRTALGAGQEDGRRVVRETACHLLARMDERPAQTREEAMLTAIERVVFLKEVPFFQGMTIQQLRTLAEIGEQVAYTEGQTITAEGDSGDALYAIIHGKVALQQHAKQRRDSVVRLATLGPKDYFAEMSIFDDAPYESDAIALEPTEVLLVRRAPLVALIRRQPDLALDLLRVMSQRLRQATATIAEKSQAKPKKLMDLYDKL